MINFARKYNQVLTIMALAMLMAACGSGEKHHLSSSDDPNVYYTHSVAFRNHSTFTWGANTYGQLGIGDNNSGHNKETPVQVVGVNEAGFLTGIDGVSAGGTHILAFKNNGDVYSWGNNGLGQLGTNQSDSSPSSTPVHVITVTNTLLSGVTAVSAGGNHCLALKSDKTVWAWGSNIEGQLGLTVEGDNPHRNAADQISGLAAVEKIAAGGAHNLALMSNGQVSGWGSNTSGQLGFVPPDPTTTSIITPGNVVIVNTTTPLANVTDIAAGGSHSLFVADGAVWACGNNIYGQIGDGTTVNKKQGVVQVNLTGVSGVPQKVAAGLDHSLVLMNNGTVWGWGLNNFGQLGSGAPMSDITPVKAPVQVLINATTPLSGIVKIAAIGNHNLAIDNTGQLWVWGYNNYGQLGLNDTDDRNYATKVPGFSANSGM
jgi:alpha-tubulin suppressor-like RCC1 family protein